jgi:hypothetical protein
MLKLKNTFPPNVHCPKCNCLITPVVIINHSLPPVRVRMWTGTDDNSRWCVFNQTKGYEYPGHKCTLGGCNSNAWKGSNERGSSSIKPQIERTEDKRKILNCVAFLATFNQKEKELTQ